LAVGTPSGVIAIYDVRTSSKWKVLEGHTNRVFAVEFD
jgi:WD40 repeat protein